MAHIIPNAVSKNIMHYPRGYKQKKKDFVYVGRYSKYKGITQL